MNKYTQRAEDYYAIIIEGKEIKKRNECLLSTALKQYGGGDNKKKCELLGHIFCYCSHCIRHPTCRRCRLYMENGHYL